eukprot:scaffold108532_cov13-Tisochrysis_lutea.AAC.1
MTRDATAFLPSITVWIDRAGLCDVPPLLSSTACSPQLLDSLLRWVLSEHCSAQTHTGISAETGKAPIHRR